MDGWYQHQLFLWRHHYLTSLPASSGYSSRDLVTELPSNVLSVHIRGEILFMKIKPDEDISIADEKARYVS